MEKAKREGDRQIERREIERRKKERKGKASVTTRQSPECRETVSPGGVALQ